MCQHVPLALLKQHLEPALQSTYFQEFQADMAARLAARAAKGSGQRAGYTLDSRKVLQLCPALQTALSGGAQLAAGNAGGAAHDVVVISSDDEPALQGAADCGGGLAVGGHRLPPPALQDAGALREQGAEVDAAAMPDSGAPREAEVDAGDGQFYVGCEWTEKIRINQALLCLQRLQSCSCHLELQGRWILAFHSKDTPV